MWLSNQGLEVLGFQGLLVAKLITFVGWRGATSHQSVWGVVVRVFN